MRPFALAQSIVLLAHLSGYIYAVTSHFPGEGDEPIVDDGKEAGPPLVENVPKAGETDPSRGAAKSSPAIGGATSRPLYIFAYDVELQKQSDLLRVTARKKVPGSLIVEVTPFSVENLEVAYTDAMRKDSTNKTPISSALLIINAPATYLSSNGLQLKTKAGLIPEKRWVEAIRKLSESVFGIANRRKMETILLTDTAGSIGCKTLPGPIFGMTPAGFARNPEVLTFWAQFQSRKNGEVFPTSAREWFDSWAFTNKLSRRRYFYCPVSSRKGYLGYKTQADPVGDNGGVDWKMDGK